MKGGLLISVAAFCAIAGAARSTCWPAANQAGGVPAARHRRLKFAPVRLGLICGR